MARTGPSRSSAAERSVARRHDHRVGRAIEYAARGGYTAKGVVYGTIGLLALMTALGFGGGRIVGTRSAIETLRTQPFGKVVLGIVAVGLVGYVVWRLVQAISDPERSGNDVRGLARRAGLLVSGLTYAVLGFFTFSLLIGGGGSGASGDGSRQSAGLLMRHEGGIWVVGAIGAVLIGVGAYQAYRAYAVGFAERWKLSEMDLQLHRWAVRLSRFGIGARAVAFGLIGWFFIQAAVQADPNEARGLAGALQSFYDEPYGAVWLGLVGLGFVCYGLYCLVNARFRRIAP